MKKSEMDKLREFAQQLIHNPYAADQGEGYTFAGNDLNDFLDTFEVDPEPIEEVSPGVGVIKENTSVYHTLEEAFQLRAPDIIGCPKCGGDGWLWAEELNENPNDIHDAGIDDTRYSCDECRRRRENVEGDAMLEVLSRIEPCKGIDQIDVNKYNKPKRKWFKWSELKDKFFTKKQQKKMKEQAEKELEEEERNPYVTGLVFGLTVGFMIGIGFTVLVLKFFGEI